MRPTGDSKGDQDRKLFVGGLHHKTDEASLREYYGQWGEITDVVVMKDPHSGKSRCFGFVTFKEPSSVDEAQKSRPHEVDGKQVDSKRAMPREETSPEVHATVKKIYIGALKTTVTNEDLSNYFSQFGTIVDAQVVTAKDTNKSRGFAFVTFDDPDAVDKCILSKPHMINESKADVHKALSREEMSKMRSRPMRHEPQQQWNDGGAGYNQGWDNSYNQGYGMQSYGYGNGNAGYDYSGGYNYDASVAPPSWGGHHAADGGFGSYQQQGHGGGPMRAPAQYNRPAPYAGANAWPQR